MKMFFVGIAASLGLLLQAMSLGCSGASTSTSNTALYVFDQASSEVMVWKDMETLYTNTSNGTTTSPARTITSSYLSDLGTLAWGGMCMDRSRNRLWLLGTGGLVVRMDSVRSLSGSASSTYVRSFQLGDSDLLTNSVFGQMAVDASTGYLYITEYSTSSSVASRIWVLTSPTSYAQDATVAWSSVTQLTGASGSLFAAAEDKYGYGVAIGSSSRVFTYANSGSTMDDGLYSGGRIFLGTSSGFSSVLIGGNTALAEYGSLAADSSNSLLYVCKHLGDSGASTAPISIFKTSQFSATYNNVAPNATLNSSSYSYLRVIAHPGNKDWLVGVNTTTSDSDTGTYHIVIWKSPSTDHTTSPQDFYSYSTSLKIRGIALDGSATS